MASVEESIDIGAQPEVVFAAITDPRRAGEWNPNVIEVSDVDPYPARLGTTWRQRTVILSRPVDLSCQVVQFDPPHAGVLKISGPQRGRITTRCSPIPGGTRVSQAIEFEPPGGLLGRVGANLATPAIHAELTRTLQRMRETLEREGGARGSASA